MLLDHYRDPEDVHCDVRKLPILEPLVMGILEDHQDAIEQHYDIKIVGVEKPTLELLHPFFQSEAPRCFNSERLSNKWVKTRARDITGIVFLNSLNTQIPFDPLYEVSGGQLQFPQYKFTLNQQQGTCVLFPSDPHFIAVQNKVYFGCNAMIVFHLAAQGIWTYDPKKFPGDYQQWFQEIPI